MRTEFTPALQRARGQGVLVGEQGNFGRALRECGIRRQLGCLQIAFGGARVVAILQCELAFHGRTERIVWPVRICSKNSA